MIPVAPLIGKQGKPKTNISVEIEGVPVPEDMVATAVGGKVQMADGKEFYVPVFVRSFTDPGSRRDQIQDIRIQLFQKPLSAFWKSFPINRYGCQRRMATSDLESVVIASRVLLTEREIYLTTDEAWTCLKNFFEANAQALKGVDPARLNDVMEFLRDYRSFQGENVPPEFVRLYLRFLRELVALNILGAQLEDGRELRDQLRAELTVVFSDHTVIATAFATTLFNNLMKAGSPELCVELAQTLFFGLVRQNDGVDAVAVARSDVRELVEHSMQSSYACAINIAQSEDPNRSNLVGQQQAAAEWLVRNQIGFVETYMALYDRLDQEGWFTKVRLKDVTRAANVSGYYDQMDALFPRPKARPIN